MFDGCSALALLETSRFDASNVKNISCMFMDCSSLTSLNLSNFDTSNATEIYNMFSGCSSLSSLDLSGFDTSNVTRSSGMFSGCEKLISFKLGAGFKNVTEEMQLPNGDEGWANVKAPDTRISGKGNYAVIENDGLNTYRKAGTVLYGDVDGNGIVDGRDASMVLTHYANLSTDREGVIAEEYLINADWDRNDVIDGRDASAILTYYAEQSVNKSE